MNGTAVCLAGVLAVGGAAALASRNSEVIRKWRTWLVSAPLVAGFLWLGAPGAALLAAGLGVVGAVEYGRLARLRPADSWLVAVAAVGLPLVAWQAPGLLGRVFAGTLLAAALVPVLGGDAAAGARRAATGVFGVAWLAALTGLVLLRGAALPLIFAVSVADVGAWCAGRLGRGPALSPLSPAKRWTGVAGGALAGVAASRATPLVPAGISGTRRPDCATGPGRAGGPGCASGPGRPRRAVVTVRFGAPVFVGPVFADLAGALDNATAEARERVVALATGPPSTGVA